MSRSAIGAVVAQGVQALASMVLQVWVARALGFERLGVFAVLYGLVVVASGLVTGVVGDSLVVLPRRDPRIRAALEIATLGLAGATAAVMAAACTWSGLTSPVEGALFAATVALFCAEEVVRRTLMAGLRFWRLVAVDATGLGVVLVVLAAVVPAAPSLAAFLAALAIGQLVAGAVGIALLPSAERFLVRPRLGGLAEIARYGTWRGLQQLLRPALLTAARGLVAAVDGLTATGRLESARVYSAPALLVVSGVSSYLFASFAGGRAMPAAARLRRADRAVGLLVVLIVALSVPALALLQPVGTLLFTTAPDATATVGWLLYAAAVAATTPYGALAAAGGRQSLVFGIRLGDTGLSVALAAAALAAGAPPSWTPVLLAAGALTGGAALRFGPLRLLVRAERVPGSRGSASRAGERG